MVTKDIIGTPLRVTDYAGLISHLRALVAEGTWSVDLTNTQIVTMRRADPAFRELTGHVDYFIPDGMPLIWCLNARGAGLRDRVYGPTFMRRCLAASPSPFRHYLLGASVECLAQLEKSLLRDQPDLLIVGRQHGYFSRAEELPIIDEINSLAPDFIWVGLGTPRQQEWIHRHKAAIPRGIILAVGFAFDVNAGMKKDAPLWLQRLGMTWAFRALSEPRRLLGRYLRYNTLFLYYLIKDALAARR